MTLTLDPVRVRIHITPGQRAALLTILDGAPDAEAVQLSEFTVTLDMADPIGWLEARMAEHPRGAFPRARLHAVLRKLSAAIQGQVQPDLSGGQAGPDREPPTTDVADGGQG